MMLRLALAAMVGVPLLAARADWRDAAGLPQLQIELGGSLPTGLGIPIMMSEANVAAPNTPEIFLPQGTTGSVPFSGTGAFAGKTITPHSGPSAASGHAAAVAGIFCGSTQSLSPGVTQLHAWLADDFANELFTSTPPIFAGSVQNHSWVGSTGSDAIDTELLRRLDFIISRDSVTISTPMNNGSSMQKLLANAYHGITAGLRDGNHPHTHSNLDGLGRMKPDLVVDQPYTSYAGPAVASAAAFLLDAIRPDYPAADDPRVIKALLLSAASKQNLLGWRRLTASRPYDETYGAGELNILNAYHILAAGQQPASGSSARAQRGWDLGTTTSAVPQRYFIHRPPGQWSASLSATITWHRQISNNFTVATLADLNLRLATADGFSVGTTISQSTSAVDNVEHLFIRNLPPGDCVIEVSSNLVGELYGIAWEAQIGTGPQLQLQRAGSQNTLTLSQLDPLTAYTIQSSSDLTLWQTETTLRTADTTPATSANWQISTSATAKFYRLSWAP